MGKMLATLFIFEALFMPKIDRQDLDEYAKNRRENAVALVQRVEKEKHEAKEKLKETKEDSKYEKVSFNKPYLEYLGEQNGFKVREVISKISSKYDAFKEELGEVITIQFNDLIAKKDMKKSEYFRYINKAFSEVKVDNDYVVVFDYDSDNRITKITIIDKEKYEIE